MGELAIIVLGVGVVVALFLGRGIVVRFGRFEATVQETHRTSEDTARKVEEINHAVNQRPPGDPTLYEQTTRAVEAVEELRPQVRRIDVTLTEHLVHHQDCPGP